MEKIFIIAFILLIVQGLFSYNQIKNYRNRVCELNKKGLIGIGREKGLLKSGNITILALNKKGQVITGEKMEGITVFSRFTKIEGISGMDLRDLKEAYENKKNEPGKRAMLQAIKQLEERMCVN